MGFLSKVFKGIKKVVKKVGKGIKKVVSKVSKAYGKLGIVGQLGLMFLMPGIGQTLAGWGTSMAASSNALVSFAGQTLSAGVNFVGQVGNAFSSITEGVTSFIGDFAGAAANKLGLGNAFPSIADKSFGEAFANLGTKMSEAGSSLMKGLTNNTAGNAWFGTTAADVAKEGLLNQGTLPDGGAKLGDLTSGGLTAPTAEVGVSAAADVTGTILDPALQQAPGLAASSTQAAPSLLDSAKAKAKEFVTDLPTTTAKAAEKGVSSAIQSGIRQAVGVEQAPEYTQNTYATYVPEFAPTSSIGSGDMDISFAAPQMPSASDIGGRPFGYTANQFDSYRVYQGMLGQRGYNAPTYG